MEDKKIKLTLMPNWPKILKKYSFIFTILVIVTGGAGFVLPYIGFLQPAVSEATYGILMFTFSVLAGASQFFKQHKLSEPAIQPEVENKEEDENANSP